MLSPPLPLVRRPGPSRPPPRSVPCTPVTPAATTISSPLEPTHRGSPNEEQPTPPHHTTGATPGTPPQTQTSLHRTMPPPPTIPSSGTVKRHLSEFNKKYLGLTDFDATAATLGEHFYSTLVYASLPSWLFLRLTAFGRQESLHSFTQEASL